MRVVIVTACHNCLNMTKEYIESLRNNAGYPVELVVVDHNSTDGTSSYLKSLGNWCRVVRCPETDSISYLWNMGINVAVIDKDADIIGLTQNDMIVTKDWLKDMVEEFDRKQDKPIGVVSGFDNTWLLHYQSYYDHFEKERTSVLKCMEGKSGRDFESINSLYPGGLESFASEMKRKYNRTRIRGINISNMLLRRDTFLTIGSFKKFDFMYYEDVDYIYRVFHDNTWDSVVMPSVYVHHIGSGTSSTTCGSSHYMESSRKKFDERWSKVEGETRQQLEERMKKICTVYEV